MIKLDGYCNKKSIFDKFVTHLFLEKDYEDPYKACEHWWYNTPIPSLDGMFMHDVCFNHQGRTRALDWANGYLEGLEAAKNGTKL